MGTAFASSLFGLAGSLILGFLDLQAGQAQNRFYSDLEDWLSGITESTTGSAGEGRAHLTASADLIEPLTQALTALAEAQNDSAAAVREEIRELGRTLLQGDDRRPRR